MTDLNSNLNRIRELTETIHKLPDMSVIDHEKVIYAVENGDCTGFGLFKDQDMAVQMAHMSEGSILKNHDHEEIEIIICHEGGAVFHLPDKKIELERGDVLKINALIPHLVESKNGCKLLCVTMPASKGYPDGR